MPKNKNGTISKYLDMEGSRNKISYSLEFGKLKAITFPIRGYNDGSQMPRKNITLAVK